MTASDQDAWRNSQVIKWATKAPARPLSELALSCTDYRAMAYQLPKLHEITIQTILYRAGFGLDAIKPGGMMQ